MGDKPRYFTFQLVLQHNVVKQLTHFCYPLIIIIIIIIIIILIIMIMVIIIVIYVVLALFTIHFDKKFISIKNISIIKSAKLISNANVFEVQYISTKFNNNEHILLITMLTFKILLTFISLKKNYSLKTLFTIPFV